MIQLDFPSSPLLLDRLAGVVVQIHQISTKSLGEDTPASRVPENWALIERIYNKKKTEIDDQIESIRTAVRKMSGVVQLSESIKLEMATLSPLLLKVTEDTRRLEDAINQNSKVVEEFWKVKIYNCHDDIIWQISDIS